MQPEVERERDMTDYREMMKKAQRVWLEAEPAVQFWAASDPVAINSLVTNTVGGLNYTTSTSGQPTTSYSAAMLR